MPQELEAPLFERFDACLAERLAAGLQDQAPSDAANDRGLGALVRREVKVSGAFAAAWLEVVNVIPAILVEGVSHHGCAHDENYLTLGHAGAQLIDHVLGNDITLGDGDFVNARKLKKAPATTGSYCHKTREQH